MTDEAISNETAKDRVRAQYGAVGDAYVKSVGHATGSDLQRMVEVTQPLASERMLDLATGGGHVARAFAPHVADVVASDLTPEILTHAGASFAEQGLANVSTAIADAEAIPYPDGSFDIVTCRIAPHHFPDPAQFVREVARVMSPDGRFVLIDSTVADGEPGEFYNRFEMLRDPSHVRSLTVAEWSELIRSAGLNLRVTESFSKRHDFEEWTSRSRMSAEDRATLERMMLNASPAIREEHHAEIVDGRLVAFQDAKTLFLATK